MPEVHFSVRWPDNSTSDCYSPSRVIKDYLEVGKNYSVPDFVDRSRIALSIASARVEQKFGYMCSSAMDQLSQIERTADSFAAQENALVLVEAFRPS
ncbi:MSMEG_0570 family nitrogen starvation response protein [Glaciimonas sp. PCH181]|uniref:MSMEG_0570 family nitrogen starvation response protein n=1 Tax=Glaciimonas sp. PCH181 TaxID=2133943 RepID=UPI000D3B5398|nr:MSMEG_0570 family nitrogen starvation response protein [Glaciimonas sp. PCH181]PUA19428.1 MSMEG_0570 family nitrogen starvation response protein [Glaciimonas sp. PCH181]